MLRKKIGDVVLYSALLVGIGIIFCSHASARSVKTEDFPYHIALEGKPYEGPVKIDVPREVLIRSDRNLSDCRVFDDLGSEVPFFIDTDQKPLPKAVKWEIVRSQKISEGVVYHIRNSEQSGSVKDLEIISGPAPFYSDMEVFSGSERTAMLLLARSRIADLRPAINTYRIRIDLPGIPVTDLKVLFRDPGKNIQAELVSCGILDPGGPDNFSSFKHLPSVRGFSSNLGSGITERADLDEAIFHEPVCRPDDQGNTVISLGRFDFPVEEVVILTSDGCFYRDVELRTAERDEEELYKPKGSGAIYRIPGLGLDRDTITTGIDKADFVQLRILNKGHKALLINSVSLRWARRHLIFVPKQGRSYELYYSSGSAPDPAYDIDRIIPDNAVRDIGIIPSWKAGRPFANADYEPDRLMKEQFRIFFIMGVIFLITYFVGFWIIHLKNLMPRR